MAKKFLFCVGCEKGGTTWLYEYFNAHPEYHSIGKELNILQRDSIVPTFVPKSINYFQKQINYYIYFLSLLEAKATGDFTHYEGSTENIFRIMKEAIEKAGYEIIPVYIMREPLSRAWSAFNMLGAGEIPIKGAANFILKETLYCKYKSTIQSLDSTFDCPLYFFYEDFFSSSDGIRKLCSSMNIEYIEPNLDLKINKGMYTNIPHQFINSLYSEKHEEDIKYIRDKFGEVPWVTY